MNKNLIWALCLCIIFIRFKPLRSPKLGEIYPTQSPSSARVELWKPMVRLCAKLFWLLCKIKMFFTTPIRLGLDEYFNYGKYMLTKGRKEFRTRTDVVENCAERGLSMRGSFLHYKKPGHYPVLHVYPEFL